MTKMLVFKEIRPRDLDSASMLRALEEGFKNTSDDMYDTLMRQLFSTWKPPPEVELDYDISKDTLEVNMLTDDKRVRFVEKGTKVRYATMSKDFVPKSRPNHLRSFLGKGRVLFVNKRRPRPGIKARNRVRKFGHKYYPKFAKGMSAAMSKARKRSGHAI